MDLLDDAAAHVVDAVLVEADDDGGDGAVFRDEIAAKQVVLEGAAADIVRRLRWQVLEQRPDVEPALVASAAAAFDGGSASTIVAVARLSTRWTVSTRSMSPVTCSMNCERVAREQPVGGVGLQRDDQRARAAKLLAEALVVAVDRVVASRTRRDVVVDVRDVGARRKRERAEDDEDRQREAPALDERRRALRLICRRRAPAHAG